VRPAQSRRVAAIDIGTNTVLLTIAEQRDAAEPRAIVERATITRLGEGVDKAGSLSDAAKQRTLACLREYAQIIAGSGVEQLDVVGTSAMRDAAESEAFVAEARALLGREPRVIAGSEEAELTFRGALSGLRLTGELIVFDVGGGSTEIIAAAGDRAASLSAVSLDVGSVRLSERHIHHDPPLPHEIDGVRSDVRAALATAPPAPSAATLVGVAGTVTTLAAIDRKLGVYDSSIVHGATLAQSSVDAILDRLCALTLEERRRVTGLEPGRADVIVAGAAIVSEMLRFARADKLIVSDRGVRWGLIHQLLDRPRRAG
jgi:exopolyphosphatase/guanosine-5'-triphosphate,3'-diphosphate pyrophosphatase